MERGSKTADRYLVELSQNHMNTTFSLTLSVPEEEVSQAEALLEACHLELTELESRISEFKTGSDLKLLASSAVGQWIPVSTDTLTLLEEAYVVSRWSGGAFDPAFRSANALGLELNFEWTQEGLARKKLPDSLLSFGAIGKGYALDLLAGRILEQGFRHFRLNAGGSSLVFYGQENDRVPWKLGFGWRKHAGKTMGVVFRVTSTPLFVGVSGDLEQGGHIVSSVLEPRLCSVMVTATSATRADAFSTAIYANPTLSEKYIDGGFVLVDNEDTFYPNSKFDQVLTRI